MKLFVMQSRILLFKVQIARSPSWSLKVDITLVDA